MSSGVILAGLGLAAVGFGGRYIARTMPQMAQKMEVRFENNMLVVFFFLTISMYSGSYKGFQNAQTGRSRVGELQISQGRLRPKDDKERGGSYSWRVPQRQRKEG